MLSLSVFQLFQGIVLGSVLVLALLLLWRKSAWVREPKWVRNAPLVPAKTLTGVIGGTILDLVRKGRLCRTFSHPDQPDIIRLHNGVLGGLFRDMILVKDPTIAREIMTEPNTAKPVRGYSAFRRLTGYKGSPDFLSSHSHNDPLYKRTRVRAYEPVVLMKRTVDYYDTLFVDTVREFSDRISASCTEKGGSFKVVDEMHHIATSLITRLAFASYEITRPLIKDEHKQSKPITLDEVSGKHDMDLFQSAASQYLS